MGFQSEPGTIRWKIHLSSSPNDVHKMLSTDEGRAKFWAETTEADGIIHFKFPSGVTWDGKILENNPPRVFSVDYFDHSKTLFLLTEDGKGGTDLELIDTGVNEKYRTQTIAGWGSVLMSLKGAVDFGVDLRNNDPKRTWDQGYFDN